MRLNCKLKFLYIIYIYKIFMYNIDTSNIKEVIVDSTTNHFYADKANYQHVFTTLYHHFMDVPTTNGIIIVHIPYTNTETNYSSYISIYLESAYELKEWFGKFFDMSFLKKEFNDFEYDKYWIKTNGFKDLS